MSAELAPDSLSLPLVGELGELGEGRLGELLLELAAELLELLGGVGRLLEGV